MSRTAIYDHKDQATRRRRARVTQTEMARRLKCAISKVSQYETSGRDLPWKQTPEDYERELLNAIRDKERAA